jgi:hypothetical protein
LYLFSRLDRLPLSRPRGQVEKDFSDGILAAEIIKYYFPDLIELKEYLPSQNIKERIALWK